MLSLVRALASCFSPRFTCLGLNCERNSFSTASMSRCAYQTSRLFMAAKRAMRCGTPRRVEHDLLLILDVEAAVRATISMLTARRLTSHSHGPGSVSSKSLMSNTSWRSGEAKTPKFERCASPQHCTVKPRARRRREVAGHDERRSAVERERRDEHAPVADRTSSGTRVFAWLSSSLIGSGAAAAARRRRGLSGHSARPPCRAPRSHLGETASMSRCAYQTSRFFMAAKPAIAVRYASTVSSTICSWSLTANPLKRAAMSMLTARRFTSHSQGPGSVSSKSLMSNTS